MSGKPNKSYVGVAFKGGSLIAMEERSGIASGAMRVLIQRVTRASVQVGEQVTGQIGRGLLVLVGIEEADNEEDGEWLAAKTVGMRIFGDSEGKMNLDVRAIGGEILVVSQFTLHASTKKGNRPSFIRAARPEHAVPLYEKFKEQVSVALGRPVAAGIFGADMKVDLVNDGPVTLWVDSRSRE
jgi:D-tyrosyl-tRNA(Tyr) deacylase